MKEFFRLTGISVFSIILNTHVCGLDEVSSRLLSVEVATRGV